MGLRNRLALKSSLENETEGGVRTNKDLQPVPLGSPERKWTWPSLLGFWIAEAFSISMYQVASTSVAAGLNPGIAIVAVFVGHALVCIPAMLDGYVGAMLGINFPVYCRSAFGMRGSYAAVFIRGIVAVIWFGKKQISFRLGGIALLSLHRHSILPRRPMPPSHDRSNMALLRPLSKPHPGKRPRNIGGTTLLLPFHHHSTTSTISPRINTTLPIHDQNHHHADFRVDTVHLGRCNSWWLWPDFQHADENH